MKSDGAISTIQALYERTLASNGYLDHRKITSTKVVFGVVLDATGPIRTKTGQLFQKIKLIDETQNINTKSYDKPYLHLFNFMKTPDEVIHVESIGDQVVLFEYNFKIFEEHEFQAWKNKQHSSRLKVIRINSLESEFKSNALLHRSLQLREWALAYFSQISLTEHSWFQPLQLGQPFDILVRVIHKEGTDLTLADKSGSCYRLVIGDERSVAEGQSLKIRDITVDDRRIVPSENSNILFVPDSFRDAKELRAIPSKQEEVANIRNSGSHLPVTSLQTIMSSPDGTIAKVRVDIVDVLPDRVGQALYYVDGHHSKGVSLEQAKGHRADQIGLMVTFALRDSSVDNLIEGVMLQPFGNNIFIDITGVNSDNYVHRQASYESKILSVKTTKTDLIVQKMEDYLIVRESHF